MTQAFNLSQLANLVNTSGQLNAATGLYNQTPVANGGTGVATIASGAVVLGAGTSAITTVSAASTGEVLTANGTAWVSQLASGGTPIVRLYTSPSPWTKPATLKAVKVTALGGGGGGGRGYGAPAAQASLRESGGSGGFGGSGFYYAQAPAIPGPVTINAGDGGAAQTAGTAASFGGLFSVAGGGQGTNAGPQTPGNTGTPGVTVSVTSTPNTVTAKSLQGILYGVNGVPAASTPSPSPPAGNPGTGFGVGGGGGPGGGTSGANGTGTAGQTGFVIVEEFY
jgi:hypothetical protein